MHKKVLTYMTTSTLWSLPTGSLHPGADALAACHGCAPLILNVGESAGMQGVIGAIHSGHRMACRI
jgi:hypothetical protein